MAKKFDAPVTLDPWQAILMAQRLRARGVRVEEYNFSSDNRKRLFSILLDLIRNGKLKARPHDELKRELLGLEVQETVSGWRVDHRSRGHDDHVIAVGLAVQAIAGNKVTINMDDLEIFGQLETTDWQSPWASEHEGSPWDDF